MMRACAAVCAGFAAMSVFALGVFAAAHAWLGVERVLCAGGYEPTPAWMLVSVVLGSLAALVGGATCGRLARSPVPVHVLAGLTLGMGLAYAALVLLLGLEPSRTRDTSFLEAQFALHYPTWWLFLAPGLDGVGILLAGSWALRGRLVRTVPTPAVSG